MSGRLPLACSTPAEGTASFFLAYYSYGNRYMMKPPHTGGTIPIQFKGKELLLAWTHSAKKFEPVQLGSSTDSNVHLKGTLNGGPVHPINENRNRLVIPEKPFQITGSETEVANLKWLGYPPAVIVMSILIVCFSPAFLYWTLKRVAGKRYRETTESNARPNDVSEERKSQENDSVNRDGSVGLPGTPHDKGSSYSKKMLDNKIKEEQRTHVQNVESSEGKWVGKLYVSTNEIRKGSNGTVVLQGDYENRPVAVKRLLHAYHHVADTEIKHLLASDTHPNIVRYYGVETNDDFVYISLERCSCSLADLILRSSGEGSTDIEDSYSKGTDKDIVLWSENGLPSAQLLELMRDVVSGLVKLHNVRIIHGDLKPENVLISTEGVIKAKLSDMGTSKELQKGVSSLSHATGIGSSDWQSREKLLDCHESTADDVFSLGCILFFCITKGKHPFGVHSDRDPNIIENKFDPFLVNSIPEAVHLLSLLLDADPDKRPEAKEVLNHPFFWNAEMRVSFLRDTSDRIDKTNEAQLLSVIQNVAKLVFGKRKRWDTNLDKTLIGNLGMYRRYDFNSVRDLLRVIRNSSSHYMELPHNLQVILGSLPEGFDRYFSKKFPKLLIQVYGVIRTHCSQEESFSKYFNDSMT